MTTYNDDTMFRYAAASYLRSWIDIDRRYVQAFDNALTSKTVGDLLREYKAIRNFKKKNEKESDERFQKFVDVLARIRAAHAGVYSIEPVKLVTDINAEIRSHYQSDKHKNFVSASSKAAWMLFRHPIAIYDSLACEALQEFKYKFTPGDYESYYRAWDEYRSASQTKIESAAQWVATSDYAHRIANHEIATLREIAEWANADWFHNRICDQRLMWRGSKDVLLNTELAALISRHEVA